MKLTSKQREVLRMLADGWSLTWMSGLRYNPHAFMRRGDSEHRTVRVDYIYKFREAKFIEMTSDPRWAWRDATYRITDAGKEAIT